MKNAISTLLLLVVAGFTFAQSKIDAHVSFATFQSDGLGFAEVYLHVLGPSVTRVELADGMGQSSLEVVILFKRGEEILKFDKFRLNGPVAAHPTDFVDVKRYSLPNGEYQLDVSLEDVNNKGDASQFSAPLKVDYVPGSLAISDIELLASATKAQPDAPPSPMLKGDRVLEPMPTNYYQKNDEMMLYYFEVYNTDKAIGSDYALTMFIDDADTKEKVEIIGITHKRKKPEPVTAMLQTMDIKSLPSGNYHLVVELRNSEKAILARKVVPFQRSNPYLNLSQQDITSGKLSLQDEFVGSMTTDELIYNLKAIFMQVDKGDGDHLKAIIADRNDNAMRLYLFSYWAKKSSTNPKVAFDAYMKVARQVDENYQNGFGYGFETDRGYIFLKYGAPTNMVFEENEPSAPPYEIWFYNQFPATSQNNVKFLFYNPSLVSNGHVLLHSTARGERNNPRWEIDLYSNAPNEIQDNDFIDGTRMQGNTGRQARRLFESF